MVGVFAFALPTMSFKANELQAIRLDQMEDEIFAVLSAMEVDRAMVELDLKMKIIRANPLAQKKFDLKAGGTIDHIVPGEFMPKHQHAKSSYKRQKPVEVIHTIECQAIDSSGNRVPVRIRIAATATRWIALIVIKSEDEK